MNLATLYDFYNIIKEDNMSFVYQGEFSDDMTEMIASLSEFDMLNANEVTRLKKKVFFLMVESFQNIVRHGEKTKISYNKTANKAGIFLTRNIGDVYYITSANLIKSDQIDILTEKLKNINDLDEKELKALYLDILSNEGLTSRGGAGLGLIEMARKSGQKLEFEFEKVNENYAFFYLQIKILSTGVAHGNGSDYISLGVTKEFHAKMVSDNVLMVHQGNFSQASILPLLQIIEDNMEHQLEEMIIKKRVYLILIELLQNISKHGLEQNGIPSGIFLMGKKNHKYMFGAGNMIRKDERQVLEEYINELNSLKKDELTAWYKKKLREGSPTEKGGAGLGLLDIARESKDKILIDFKEIDENTSFFSIIAGL